MLLLADCAPAPPKPTGRLRVVTTMGVLADWARQVGGDRVEVTSLLTGNKSPHTYEIKPADVKTVADAGILFRVGLVLEEWLDPAGQNSRNTRLVVVDAADGITDVIVDEGDKAKSEARSQKPERPTPNPQPPVPSPCRGQSSHLAGPGIRQGRH